MTPSADPVWELTRQLTERWRSSRVHPPGDREYGDASRLWNAAVAVRPALVVRPRSSAEAATAVTLARESGVGLSVRGGGHDWAGRALREDGLVLDLEHLRDVHISGDAALFGGGSRAADVVAAAASHGGLVGGTIVFDWNEAQTVLARYAELIGSAPDGLNILIEMTWMPDIGACLLAVPTWSGPPQEADTALAPYDGWARRWPTPSPRPPRRICSHSSISTSPPECTGTSTPAPSPL